MNSSQKNHAQFKNLIKGRKYHWWIPRLPKRVKFKEKKMYQHKTKSQQAISKYIHIY